MMNKSPILTHWGSGKGNIGVRVGFCILRYPYGVSLKEGIHLEYIIVFQFLHNFKVIERFLFLGQNDPSYRYDH